MVDSYLDPKDKPNLKDPQKIDFDWKKGRPADWIGNPDYCGRCQGTTMGICTECCKAYEAGASAMLPARDKWWLEKIKKGVVDWEDGYLYIKLNAKEFQQLDKEDRQVTSSHT